MSRNTFERDDPAEEVPLEEETQRQFTVAEVDEAIDSMTDRERALAVGAQFKDVEHIDANIAKLKQEGLWATARFYERLLRKQAT
jgi:hypothetical protein